MYGVATSGGFLGHIAVIPGVVPDAVACTGSSLHFACNQVDWTENALPPKPYSGLGLGSR